MRSTSTFRPTVVALVALLFLNSCGSGSLTTVQNVSAALEPPTSDDATQESSEPATPDESASADPPSTELGGEQEPPDESAEGTLGTDEVEGAAPVSVTPSVVAPESPATGDETAPPAPLPTVGPTPGAACIVGFSPGPNGMCVRLVPAVQPPDLLGCNLGFTLSEDGAVCSARGAYLAAVIECPADQPRLVEGNCYGSLTCLDAAAVVIATSSVSTSGPTPSPEPTQAAAGESRCFEPTSRPAAVVSQASCNGITTQLAIDACMQYAEPVLITPPLSCPPPSQGPTIDGTCVETFPPNS